MTFTENAYTESKSTAVSDSYNEIIAFATKRCLYANECFW